MRRPTFGVLAMGLGLGLLGSLVWATACGVGGSGATIPNEASASDGGSPGSFDNGLTDGPPPKSLYFDPPTATVTVSGSGTVQASFTLKAVDASGSTYLVTADSVAFDRPDLATITDGEPVVATAPSSAQLYGGTGTVHAIFHGVEATAALTVVVHMVAYGPGLGPTSPSVVALNANNLGSDPAPAISPLLYPYDKTVWPLGMTSPLLMWNAPSAGDVYRLHYAEKDFIFDGYYALSGLPGQMRLDQAVWNELTASNDAANSTDPLTFALSRYDTATKVAYATSTQTWTIAPEPLSGAIYYWSASQNAAGVRRGHISRFQPGTGATPVPLNNGKCMGCHAVNAQGTVLVADIDDMSFTSDAGNTDPSVEPYGNYSGTRPWAAFNISNVPNAPDAQASISPDLETNKFGADVALTPDGKYVVFGGPTQVATKGWNVTGPSIAGSKYISLAQVSNGQVIANSGLDEANLDPNMGIEMPAFSPDGTKLAVVEAQYYSDNILPNAADPDAGVSEFIG